MVAIRDGKISTETIRRVSPMEQAMSGDQPAGERSPDHPLAENHLPEREVVTYYEYVVLDSAGRLQVPREILEDLGIGKRAQLETGENCIIIRPTAGQGSAERGNRLTLEEQLALLFKDQPPPPARRRRSLLAWLQPRHRK